MSDPLSGKNIVLGVCGSAACYKAVDLASKLTQRGASVNVIMTDAAQKFISPLYFNAITRNKVVSDIFSPTYDTGMDHIAISKNADIFVIAPTTINKIAHIANGFANDALTDALMASNRAASDLSHTLSSPTLVSGLSEYFKIIFLKPKSL